MAALTVKGFRVYHLERLKPVRSIACVSRAIRGFAACDESRASSLVRFLFHYGQQPAGESPLPIIPLHVQIGDVGTPAGLRQKSRIAEIVEKGAAETHSSFAEATHQD